MVPQESFAQVTVPGSLRTRYATCAAAVIVVGLVVHFHATWLWPTARDVIGDALWATMIACVVSSTSPGQRSFHRNITALGICYAVELSQLSHLPVLRYARSTSVGRLVIGSGFDPRDFIAYALGIAVFAILDRRWLMRTMQN